jgi:hypothetical protein
MPRRPDQGSGKIALVDSAEAGKMAGAVDRDLVPDAAGIPLDHEIAREIEALGNQVGDHIFGVVGDASACIVIGDRNDIAMDGAAVDRTWAVNA